jgi:hypothetical protein
LELAANEVDAIAMTRDLRRRDHLGTRIAKALRQRLTLRAARVHGDEPHVRVGVLRVVQQRGGEILLRVLGTPNHHHATSTEQRRAQQFGQLADVRRSRVDLARLHFGVDGADGLDRGRYGTRNE